MAKDNVGMVVGVLLAVLLGFGIFVFLQEPTTAVANNYEWTNGNSVFEVNVISEVESYITVSVGVNQDQFDYTIALRNDPASLEDIPVQGNWNTRIFDDEGVYITFHPYANLTSKTTIAAYEIAKIIDNEYLYDIDVYSAVVEPYGDYPTVRCEDATDAVTVIYLTLGSETTVFTEDYCIYVVGTDEDELIRAADRFVYGLLEIMPVN